MKKKLFLKGSPSQPLCIPFLLAQIPKSLMSFIAVYTVIISQVFVSSLSITLSSTVPSSPHSASRCFAYHRGSINVC